MTATSRATRKAWRTRKLRAAGFKAWQTMRKIESKMSAKELKALAGKRSLAGKKAWKTIRARAT